ncbi:baseplate J/gp47 family protein [Agrobacterium rosae]|uniref:baseplate J/gp47 family protein n=1 Tax=Agrobacterium rosae TaxID=1972867 RepID=UPI0011B4394E|nr:baseplate J/gp47 family protein [Agrobacterium rosae]
MITDSVLNQLPPPQVVEQLDYEILLARQSDKFKALWSAVRAANPDANLPDYDVAMLETDPPVIVNEAESYRELLMRQRVNEAAVARLLAFATFGNLDHLAAFYDVVRMAGEKDDRLKRRVILAIQGRSPGGTEARYASIAMDADIRVRDAIVYTVGRSPVINVAIFSDAADGVADAALISAVNAALQAGDKRMVNDTIIVRTAVRRVIDLVANVWLLPDTSTGLLSTMETTLRDAWAKTQSLGRDFTERWWTARLMLEGVHKVEPVTPVGDVIVPPDEALAIGAVTLNFKGRAF